MNWQCLRRSSRSSWLKVISFQTCDLRSVSGDSPCVHVLMTTYYISSFPSSASEMLIIDEYERNQQFEQQYISSVVEEMDDMHLICPLCHM